MDVERLEAENADLRKVLERLLKQLETYDQNRLTSRLDLHRVIQAAESVLEDSTIKKDGLM